MNNQNLIIYDFKILFDILNEIANHLSFKLLNVSKKDYSKLELDKLHNYLIISKKKIVNSENQIFIKNYPLKLIKLIEIININFIKKNLNNNLKLNWVYIK